MKIYLLGQSNNDYIQFKTYNFDKIWKHVDLSQQYNSSNWISYYF